MDRWNALSHLVCLDKFLADFIDSDWTGFIQALSSSKF